MKSDISHVATSRARRIYGIPARAAAAAFMAAALAAIGVPAATAAAGPVAKVSTASHASIGAPNATVQVMYRGHTVSYAQLNKTLGITYCDDFRGFGKLTCYSTEKAMEEYLLAHGGYSPQEAARVAHQLGIKTYAAERTVSPPAPAAGTCHPYAVVQLWSRANYTGSEVNIYCDYPNLGAIGWANRAKSGKIPSVSVAELLYVQRNYAQLEVEFNIIRQAIASFAATSNSVKNCHAC